jgi:uncharacterized protein YecE (DUF72 family)
MTQPLRSYKSPESRSIPAIFDRLKDSALLFTFSVAVRMSGYNTGTMGTVGTFPVRFGTSSFSASGWVGTFYPKNTKPKDYLANYARKLDTVEVDSTFYGVPQEKTVQSWYEKTPPGFVFAAKMPEAITHDKGLDDCDQDLAEFLSVMSNLREKLGPLLFQFPYYAKKSGMTEEEFIERVEKFLPKLPREMKFAVELRNKAWVSPRLLDALRKHKVALAMVDHPYMARPKDMLAIDAVTADFAYSRLLGDRYEIEAVTKTWDKTIVDRTKEIDEWAEVTDVLRKRVPVYTYVNNHFAGHAPATVAELKKRIFGEQIESSSERAIEPSGQMSLL